MTTLSQIGLAIHLQRSAKWVRSQGELVTGISREGNHETWARKEFSNLRCAGYERMTSQTLPGNGGRPMICVKDGEPCYLPECVAHGCMDR